MKIHKIPVCMILGHTFKEKSIVNTICKDNWLRKCERCGMYIMHGQAGSVMLTEKQAFKVKEDFEKAFPYSKKEV